MDRVFCAYVATSDAEKIFPLIDDNMEKNTIAKMNALYLKVTLMR